MVALRVAPSVRIQWGYWKLAARHSPLTSPLSYPPCFLYSAPFSYWPYEQMVSQQFSWDAYPRTSPKVRHHARAIPLRTRTSD